MQKLPEPWRSFFSAIDESLSENTRLEILGGFIVTVLYGAPRSTSDVDVVSIAPNDRTAKLIEIAGEGSTLHEKHGVYLDRVGVAPLPEDYQARLTEIYAFEFRNLQMLALDPYDIALAKIERNIDRDREDVLFLAGRVPFDLEILKERYFNELRPVLGIPEREDLTLRLWTEMIEEFRREN